MYELLCEKTGLRGFRPGLTQTDRPVQLQKMVRSLNFGIRKKRKCIICVAKTKALISFAVTAKLICAFVFASAKIRFSHDVACMCSIAGG